MLELTDSVHTSRYNKRNALGLVDFRRVFGIDGIYFANRYNSSNAFFAETVISFNKGVDWRSLKAPTRGADNKPITCGKGCSLHLLGRTDSTLYNQLYSNKNAVGLVIANGTHETLLSLSLPFRLVVLISLPNRQCRSVLGYQTA